MNLWDCTVCKVVDDKYEVIGWFRVVGPTPQDAMNEVHKLLNENKVLEEETKYHVDLKLFSNLPPLGGTVIVPNAADVQKIVSA